MNKTIEKAEKKRKEIVTKRIEKLKLEYDEARREFAYRPYLCFQRKMDRCRAEIIELEEYLEKDNIINSYEGNIKMMQHEMADIKKTLANKLFYLLQVIPDCSEARSLSDYLEKLKI